MKKYNIINNKGITLLALVITIIILLILASVTINISTDSIKETDENTLISELKMVQHAALERYTKAVLTHERYPGTTCSNEDLNAMTSLGIELKDVSSNYSSNYYKITAENGFEELGIKNSEDEYIVNYITGEVFNLTKKKTESGELLYVYAKTNENKEESKVKEYVKTGLILHYK